MDPTGRFVVRLKYVEVDQLTLRFAPSASGSKIFVDSHQVQLPGIFAFLHQAIIARRGDQESPIFLT